MRLQFPPLSLKIWNKLHDISQNCLQCSSTQPWRDYHIVRIHLQRAVMHSETQFSTQVRLPAPLYINLYSERPFRPVHSPSSRWSIYQSLYVEDFAFWYVIPILFFHYSWSPSPPPPPPTSAAGGIFTRECGGWAGLTDGVTLAGVTCDTEWPWGGGGRQVVSFALNLAALPSSTMCQHRICRFYLHFRASNNHLARCDKFGVGAGQALSLNLQHGILTTVSNHSFCCSIYPLSVRPFQISLSLSLLDLHV